MIRLVARRHLFPSARFDLTDDWSLHHISILRNTINVFPRPPFVIEKDSEKMMVNPLKEQSPRNESKNTEFLVAEVRKLISIVDIVD